MKTVLFLAVALVLAVTFQSPAHASGDESCSPSWSLTGAAYDPCNNVPFLSPGNDTQVNLRLLTADAAGIEIPAVTLSDYDRNSGFGLVPFALEVLMAPPMPADAGAGNADQTTSDQASGEGTRCSSNTDSAAKVFTDQVNNTAGISDADKSTLAVARQGLVGTCDNNAAAISATPQSAPAKDFALYLTGAQAFYAGNFPTAAQAFSALGSSGQPWLKEAALYMVARTALNAAQVNAFDEYGFPKLENVDQVELKTAEAGFTTYLQAYPQGAYAASARGLMRRVYWLMANQEQLAVTYGAAMAQSGLNASQAVDLALEIDNKLLTGVDIDKIKDPLLLAVVDLMAMRPRDAAPANPYLPVTNTTPAQDFTLARLQAQQPLFAGHEALFTYLQAAYDFYVAHDAAATLKALPEIDTGKPVDSYLAFSTAMLRGLALEATAENGKARTLWVALLPLAQQPLSRPTLELALATNLERAHQVDAVFAADSAITSAEIRSLLLRKSAGPALLRQQITAASAPAELRNTALFTLLYKDLTFGHYGDFASDLKLAPLPDQPVLPDDLAFTYFGSKADLTVFTKPANGDAGDGGYECPVLEKVAVRLQQNAKDPQGLLCLGEFIRGDFDYSPLDQIPDKGSLGGSFSDFSGKAFSRLTGYMTVIDSAKAAKDDKAYALYRAINCYAPSGYNSCDAQDIPKSQRKKWFQTLKTRYADTVWAQNLQYYW